ncbi:uncharacterized protein isoform X2 [Rhodnius prolixus]|uniref:uncharacterized protein isoform X2 n=1 Tax=Rhodnius prolixus TaxID=13249 RepID=UPI003D188824
MVFKKMFKGDFGVYFYTGNFCYYSGFTSLMCPQMKGIISYKSLSRLYFDATYYEQKSKFMDYDEIVDKVVGIILCANFSKRTDIVVDIFGLEMLLIDIALNVRKKYPKTLLHVGYERFLMMCELGCKNLFTYNLYDSRIYIRSPDFLNRKFHSKAFCNLISIKRKSELCQDFQSYVQINGWHEFTFYSHSSHERCCILINLFKPEVLIPTRSLAVNSDLIMLPNFSFFSKKEHSNIPASYSDTKHNKVSKLMSLTLKKKVKHSKTSQLKNVDDKSSSDSSALTYKKTCLPSSSLSEFVDKKAFFKSEKYFDAENKDFHEKIMEGPLLHSENNDRICGKVSFQEKRKLFIQFLKFNIKYGKILFKYKFKNQTRCSRLKKVKLVPTLESIKKLFLTSVRYGNVCILQKSFNPSAQVRAVNSISMNDTKTHLGTKVAKKESLKLEVLNLDQIRESANKYFHSNIQKVSSSPKKNIENMAIQMIGPSSEMLLTKKEDNCDSDFNLKKNLFSEINSDLILNLCQVKLDQNSELILNANIAARQENYEDEENAYSVASLIPNTSLDENTFMEKEKYRTLSTFPMITVKEKKLSSSEEVNCKQNLVSNENYYEIRKCLVVSVDRNLEASSGYYYSASNDCYLPIIYKYGFKGFLKSSGQHGVKKKFLKFLHFLSVMQRQENKLIKSITHT